MAEELFRFMTTRPPQTMDAATIDLTTNSPFQRGLLAESGAQNWPQRVALATAFIDKGPFVLQTSSLKFMPGYESFRNAIEPVDPKVNRNTVDAAIAQAFQSKASALVKNADYKTDRVAVDDSILALFIAPRSAKARGPSLLPLVRIAQTMLLIEQVADASQTIDAAAVTAALKATLVLPPLIFPPKPNGLQPVGVADLLVVKQHLKRYELGEIAKIENLLRGESRKLSDKHTLTTEQTTVSETETTTETTKELQTEERFDLKRASGNTSQADIRGKGGARETTP